MVRLLLSVSQRFSQWYHRPGETLRARVVIDLDVDGSAANPNVGLLGKLSIRRKLMLIIMIVSFTAILLAAAAFIVFQWIAIRHRMESDLSAQAQILGDSCSGALLFNYPEDAEEILVSAQANASINLVAVYRKDGSLFATWQREGVTIEPPPAPEPAGIRYEEGILLIFREITVDNELEGILCLRAHPSEMYAFLRLALFVLPLSMLLSLMVAYLLAAKMQGLISGPVSALTETARAVARKEDYSLRAVKRSEDELGVLTDTFNLMLDRVQSRDAALRESQQNLQTLFDTLDDFLLVLDTEGRILQVNPVVQRRLGYSAVRLSRMSIIDIHAAEQADEVTACFAGLQSGEPGTYTVPLWTIDGKPIPVETKVTPGRWGGKEVLFGISRDISERIRTQEALRLTQFSVDHGADAAYWIDPQGRYVYVNHAASRMLGYSRDELLGMTVSDIDPSLSAETWKERWSQVRTEGSLALETRHRTKDGRLFPVEITTNFVEFEGKAYCCAFARDVTERKLAEGEVRRLRNLLSNIVDSMPSVLVGVDTEGRVTQWNREAERATKLAATQVRGHYLADVYPQLTGEMKKVFEAIRTRQTQKDLKVANEAEGDTRYADVTVYPLVADGIEGAVIRVDDVTERVRIEEMMIQSEKMLSVGGLAAGMAHEINNPLAGILQNVQVMRNRFSASLPKNQRIADECGISMTAVQEYMMKRGVFAMIEAIISSGQRAAQIVDNMLSFSRKSDAQFALHDLSVLLDKTVELACNDYDLKKKHDFRKIEIVRQYAPQLPQVPCEASKVQQVLLNLLRNAAEAMALRLPGDAENDRPPEPPRITLRLACDGEMARVEIEDNGPGMDESVRRRIFEPFFTTKGAMGTGLGLSVSYFIITENHLGTMSVESAPGKGSRFLIRLPYHRAEQ